VLTVRIQAVVLAAGRGRRMGRPKHLIEVPVSPGSPTTEPLLARALRPLQAGPFAGLTVVLRPGDTLGEGIARRLGARPAYAWPDGEGRAASVRAGVRSAPDVDGWLFVPCDQPRLDPEAFRALAERFAEQPTRVVCAAYAGERGSPTLFPARLRPELLALRGAQGGRVVIRRHPDAVERVELDPALARDVDTPEDLRALFGVDLSSAPATMPRAMQRTLSIIKPDAVAARNTGSILQAIEAAGLDIVAVRKLTLTPEQAAEFYAVHKERPFYKSLCEFMISGPIVVSALEGEDAIQRYRTLMGATDPAKADEGTLRRRFASDVERNAVHGSDAPETAQQEIRFFFPELG